MPLRSFILHVLFVVDAAGFNATWRAEIRRRRKAQEKLESFSATLFIN
jgi:hypothetical protein